MALHALCAIASSSVAQAQNFDYEPFERLGDRVIAAADARATGATPPSDTTLARLAPLHDVWRVGAFELWAPREVVDAKGELEQPGRFKDVARRAARLVDIQTYWLEKTRDDATRLESARASLVQLTQWVKSIKTLPTPEPSEAVTTALRDLETFYGTPMPNGRRLTLIHAPTRAQLVGVVGARGRLTPRLQRPLWTLLGAKAAIVPLDQGATVTANSWAPFDDETSYLRDHAMAPAESDQWFTHAAAQLLATWLLPMAPPWLIEALAVDTTIALSGADETLCSGCSELEWIARRVDNEEGANVLIHVTRDRSSYRGGPSSSRFRKPLRAALRGNGFIVLDLDRGEPGAFVEGLLLGPDAQTPAAVVNGPQGVRKGYAEFYRAYCVAFVDYLHGEGSKPLPRLLRGLHAVRFDPRPSGSTLHPLTQALFGRTIGEVDDPTKDFEAEFRAWLKR